MRHLGGTSTGLVLWLALWIGGTVVAVDVVMALLGSGEHLLAVLAFCLALGGLAAGAIAMVVPFLFLED